MKCIHLCFTRKDTGVIQEFQSNGTKTLSYGVDMMWLLVQTSILPIILKKNIL